ncbi:MAG: RDD family protein [Salibacteraceae bacterium]
MKVSDIIIDDNTLSRPVETVTGWTRFGHFVLDYVLIVLIQRVFGFFLLTKIVDYLGMDYISWFRGLDIAISIAIFFLYYFLQEVFFQRTIGKMVTQAVVINEYAKAPSWAQIAGRSLIRIVPFEFISCLGPRGWHDLWTNTYVVKYYERDALQDLLSKARDHTEESLIGSDDL